jgi:hypothetical protein
MLNDRDRSERSSSAITPRRSTYTVQSGSLARVPAHPRRSKLAVYNMSALFNLRFAFDERPSTTSGAPIYANGGEEFRANTHDLWLTNDSAAGATAITIEVYEEFEGGP